MWAEPKLIRMEKRIQRKTGVVYGCHLRVKLITLAFSDKPGARMFKVIFTTQSPQCAGFFGATVNRTR
jgi:hypothetical protein